MLARYKERMVAAAEELALSRKFPAIPPAIERKKGPGVSRVNMSLTFRPLKTIWPEHC